MARRWLNLLNNVHIIFRVLISKLQDYVLFDIKSPLLFQLHHKCKSTIYLQSLSPWKFQISAWFSLLWAQCSVPSKDDPKSIRSVEPAPSAVALNLHLVVNLMDCPMIQLLSSKKSDKWWKNVTDGNSVKNHNRSYFCPTFLSDKFCLTIFVHPKILHPFIFADNKK